MENSNEIKMSPELIAKMKECKSAEELVKLAADNGIDLSLADAEKYLADGVMKLGDDELDQVAGGKFFKKFREVIKHMTNHHSFRTPKQPKKKKGK